MTFALLRDAWHNLRSRSVATLVTVGGLALAMATCLVVALIAVALSTPDPAIPEPERVVLIDMKGNPPGMPSPWFTASPVSFGALLKERRVPLDLISRISSNGNHDMRVDGRRIPVQLVAADADIVSLLGFRALRGDLHRTLTQNDAIALSTELVRKLWNELPPAHAIGRRVEWRNRIYTVTAIIPNFVPNNPLSVPTPPSIGNAVAMVGFETTGNPLTDDERRMIFAINGRVLGRLRDGASVESAGEWMRDAFKSSPEYGQLPAEWKAGREAAYFRGLTLTQLPFAGDVNELRWQLVGTVAAASALLLLMATFNCMNLQTATLLQRQRETALRRSLGADERHLLRLWGTEASFSLLFATAAALLSAWWVAPAAASLLGLQPEHHVAASIPPHVLSGLAITVVAILAITLALPASMALRQAPAPALQGRTASEGPLGRVVRQVLLTLQLGGVVMLLSLAGVLAMQQRHLLHADRGFATENRLSLSIAADLDTAVNTDAFVAALDRHPAILSWAFSDIRPVRDMQGTIDMHVSSSQHRQVLRLSTVSPSFFTTFGMTVLAGRPRVGSGGTNIVIDAKAAQALGFATPQSAVGEVLRGGGDYLQEGTQERRIVAVVKSVKLETARAAALPQAFILSDAPQREISLFGRDMASLRQTVVELWHQHNPSVRFELLTADEQRAGIYEQEQRLTTMLTAVALLAVGVAMLGAYTLVADALRRRRTELVLRRLHGAGHAAIVRELANEFVPPFAVALALGMPLAFWLGERYLGGFVDRVATGTGLIAPMLIATLATLLVTALATLQHVRRALALQPIEAMR